MSKVQSTLPGAVRSGNSPLYRRLLTGTALSLVVSCAFPTLAAGQEAPPAATGGGGPVQMPPISVEADSPGYKPGPVQSPKYSGPMRDIPRTITVVPKEVIQERGATSVTEVLRTQPGISLGAGEGGVPLGDRAFIRGFDARTDMYVDGVRDFGGFFRDPFNLEQIEIAKGPGSAYSGRGSTGGTINLVSKQPFQGNRYNGAVTLGTDLTKRATVDVNHSLAEYGIDGAAFRINGMVHDADVAGRDEVEVMRWGIAPSLSFGLGGPTQLTLSYFHFSQDNIPDYGLPFDPATGAPVDVDRDNFYGLVDRDFDEVDSDLVTAEITHRINQSWSLNNQARYGRTSKDFIVTKPEYTAGAATVVRDDRSRDSLDTILINQTDVTGKFDTGWAGHNLTAGIELVRETSANRGRSIDDAANAALFDPNPDDPYNGTITSAATRAESTTLTGAIYAFDTVNLGKYFDVVGGLRWDNFNTNFENAAGEKFDRFDSAVTWRAAGVYKPLPYGSIYFAYGTSINPSAEGLTLRASTDALEPEESETFELGTKWDLFDERISVSAAAFRTNKTNARTTAPGDTVTVLAGEQRVDGVEFGVAGNVTEQLRLYGGYTFLDSEIESSRNPAEVGNRFANIAPHSFSLWSVYQFTPQIDGGFGAQYVARRYANNANTRWLPSYWRFDATVGYKFNQTVDFRINALNLTDETYFDSTHNGQHALVAPGRSVLFTTNVTF